MIHDNFLTLRLLFFIEAFEFLEEVISVKDSLYVAGADIPLDKVSESQVLAIYPHRLWPLVELFSGAWSTSEYYADLAASHVGALVLVSLGATVFLCIAHQASHAKQVVNRGVTDPSDISEAIVHCGKRVEHHSSSCELAIHDHDEGRLDVLAVAYPYSLSIDVDFVRICDKVTFAGLPECRYLVASRTTAALERNRGVRNLGGHGDCRVDNQVTTVVKSFIVGWHRGFVLVVHQDSNSVHLDALALNKITECCLELFASQCTAHIVAATVW